MATRKEIRNAVGNALISRLARPGGLCQHVYKYHTGTFKGENPVVMIVSAAGQWKVAPRWPDNVFEVWIFSLWADPQGQFSEQQAEDNLDDLYEEVQAAIADLKDYTITQEGRSSVDHVNIDGWQYLWEALRFVVEGG